jgi:hypothetical protein
MENWEEGAEGVDGERERERNVLLFLPVELMSPDSSL